MLAVVAVVLILPACGAPEPAPAATDFAAPPEAVTAFTDRFPADSAATPWKTNVVSTYVEKFAVRVVTSLEKKDITTGIAVCEVAYKAAKATLPDLVSVTVRTTADNSLAGANAQRADKPCRG